MFEEKIINMSSKREFIKYLLRSGGIGSLVSRFIEFSVI